MSKYIIFLNLFLPLSVFSQNEYSFKVLFYNVENLFDTIDDANVIDEEFIPSSKKAWNSEKYNTKLNHISKVIFEAKMPEIIGLGEIENKRVLEDLVNNEAIKSQNYKIIHKDSPDRRGIDVAILVKNKEIKVIYYNVIPVSLRGDNPKPTRDILYAKLLYKTDTLHVFANHWPSRIGGEQQSEINRITAAKTLAIIKDSLLKLLPESKLETVAKRSTEAIQYNFRFCRRFFYIFRLFLPRSLIFSSYISLNFPTRRNYPRRSV